MGLIPTRTFPGLPDAWFWQVGSCICGLLLRDGSKGSCLSKVPHHQKKKKRKRKRKKRVLKSNKLKLTHLTEISLCLELNMD